MALNAEALAKAPQDPFPRYGLAMELKSRGELEASATAFDELIAAFPDYADYQKNTDRLIPVFLLEPPA